MPTVRPLYTNQALKPKKYIKRPFTFHLYSIYCSPSSPISPSTLVLSTRPINITNITSDMNRNLPGTTHVDLTLVGDMLIKSISQWKYLDLPIIQFRSLLHFLSITYSRHLFKHLQPQTSEIGMHLSSKTQRITSTKYENKHLPINLLRRT